MIVGGEGDETVYIHRFEIDGGRLRGRPRKGWRDGVKEALSHKGLISLVGPLVKKAKGVYGLEGVGETWCIRYLNYGLDYWEAC